MAAGVSEAVLIVTPLETMKVKMMESQKGMLSGIAHIISTDGIGGIYKGVTATVLKQASNQGIRFFSYNEIKDVMLKYRGYPGKKDLDNSESLVAGMLAGTASVIGNNPVDVVKTRMQGTEAKNYTSTWDCTMKIVRNEGLAAFYKGTWARLARVVPGQGIIFMSYEAVKRLLVQNFT
eukprot:comp6253_c0_seq1/m.6017 comp6253_c0_seq1/g.6017  ORF comp6253_c0_seq1/g.6017 comp6253_c0_seq1/m.6017 type:complete len:178 (+) comp6253_c0_seq1:1-534(+)